MRFLRTLITLLALLSGAGVSHAAPDAAAAQARLAKDAICTKCHDETESRPLFLYQTKHGVRGDSRAPTCQSCHGESTAHATQEKNRPSPDVNFNKGGAYPTAHAKARGQSCMTCHQGGNRMHWDGGQHQRAGLACNDCHKVHQPKDNVLTKATQPEVCYGCHKTQRAETHKISTHPIVAGKVTCSDCHNPHGTNSNKLVKRANVNDTCFNCHAEKRGPFLWQHTSANDDCMNCHTPHGSNVAPLLKVRGPWLCQRCHAEVANHPGNIYSGAQLPGAPAVGNNPPVQVAFRGCFNCHQAIHGSNHPAGRNFLR
ncbi:DmsE family decaheme c-type cytochrome [Ramlibacter albus]|uniref:DmsE family decaheme c-type cytochrome n=1 Tax=Ramlibacter albus TaxID=2079448 RepID=A0A923M5Z9_9BURK|nr:DmsE family decaheme c-type cytochrome [Ramlibacter albus]MBC5764478.1 DmsE family decaheme c-type cytochrome [Ramlibacter albus]